MATGVGIKEYHSFVRDGYDLLLLRFTFSVGLLSNKYLLIRLGLWGGDGGVRKLSSPCHLSIERGEGEDFALV